MQPWSVISMRVMLGAQPVHAAAGPAPPGRVAARTPDRADVVMARIHRGEQVHDVLRRVLQVGVERHDALAAAVFEAREDRPMLAEVAVEQDHARHVRAALELLGEQLGRAITAAVVDEHDLVVQPQRVECRVQAREQRGQAGLLVVDRDDDAQARSVRGRVVGSGRGAEVEGLLGLHAAGLVVVFRAGPARGPGAAPRRRGRHRCRPSQGRAAGSRCCSRCARPPGTRPRHDRGRGTA